jgi:Fe-S-cluster containining protein
MTHPHPLVDSCDHCAACCRRTPIPPFQPGEEAALDVPAELLQPIQLRIAADQHFDLLPCVWLDTQTLKCRHYDLRPQACRDFAIGSQLCLLCRDDEGIPNPPR